MITEVTTACCIRLRLPLPYLLNTAKEVPAYAVGALAERFPLRNASPLAERFPFRLGVSVEMPGAVSLRPALTPGLRLNPQPLFT